MLRSFPRRAGVLGALVLAWCLSVPVAGCAAGDDARTTISDPAPATSSAAPTGNGADVQLVEIEVAEGQASVAADRVEVALGEQVRLAVTSDTADELHVHGYDQSVELVPGRQTTLELTADTPGLFDVELHESGLLLVQLEVR